jgi:hypothetical protein
MAAQTQYKSVTFGEYKGHPLLVFGEGSRFPFQFGVGKAKMLLDAVNEMGGGDAFAAFLRQFVQDNDNKANGGQ